MNAAWLWMVWLGLLGYAFTLAPPEQPDTLDLIQRLVRFQVAGINPLIVALFNLMGVWPGIYAAILLTDGRGQKIPAWPFVAGSFALGAFALLPYLALRRPYREWHGSVPWLLRLWNSRFLGAIWLVLTVGFLGYGLSQGSWPEWWQAFQTSRFIHVMSLDFLLLSLLFPLVLWDDMARRRLNPHPWFALVSALPLVGSALYLTLRPKLPD
ncbi:MAG: hypothetical protein Q6J18_07320 [Gloeomargarita sp. DG02_3_bins_56]